MKTLDEIKQELLDNHGLYTGYGVKDANGKFVNVVSIDAAMKVIEELITPNVVEQAVCEYCLDAPNATECMCHYDKYKTVMEKFHECKVCGGVGEYPIDY